MFDGFDAAVAIRPVTSCPFPEGSDACEQWRTGWNMARRLNPQLVGAKPPRRMPSLKKVLEYHGLDPEPLCVRCGLVDVVERAHIIDRSSNGLDNCANLAPLCRYCHAGQPIFAPEQEAEALAWFGLPRPY